MTDERPVIAGKQASDSRSVTASSGVAAEDAKVPSTKDGVSIARMLARRSPRLLAGAVLGVFGCWLLRLFGETIARLHELNGESAVALGDGLGLLAITFALSLTIWGLIRLVTLE
jgi:hypothetical protein